MATREFRVIKPEIRVIGIDDGKFVPHIEGSVIVVGAVFRGGYSLDGVMHTHVAVDGFDATEKIAHMINNSSHCKQLRLVMLNGITFGGFNVIDIKKLHSATELPILALTPEKPDLEAVHNAINQMPKSEERWNLTVSAGTIHQITSKGKQLYMEAAGISTSDAQEIVELTATRSSYPEPLRVAHLIASGVSP